MPNEYINKVEANGETLIDLTSDTVTADKLLQGETAHLASGAPVAGTFVPVTGVKGDAESEYRTGDVNITPANIGALPTAGGTMTGNLNLTGSLFRGWNTNIDVTAPPSSSYVNGNSSLRLYDNNENTLVAVVPLHYSDGRVSLVLAALNKNASSATVQNQLKIEVDRSGNQTYFVSNPANFRSAIEADVFDYDGLSHASVFRGKYLGSSFTSEQKAAIADGSFDDLYVGDYWTINGVNWRTADIDYMSGSTHHLVIVPDTALYSTQFNTTSATDTGYAGSNLYSGLSTALATIEAAFGANYIMQHSALLTNAVSNGVPTGWANYDIKVGIPSQSMLCGHRSQVHTGNDSRNDGYTYNQLSLFSLAKRYMHTVTSWTWTSDCIAGGVAVYNATNFNTMLATQNYGVRPYFCLKGA